MAGSLNKAIIVGRLGQDPKLSHTTSGTPVANFTMATDESYTKDGQKVEQTEWHRIIAWGKTAELCSKYLSKGRLVLVEGKLQTRKWEDQQGQARYTTEVVAQRVQFMDSPQSQTPPRQSAPNQTGQSTGQLGPEFPSDASGMDSVPF